MYTEHEKIHASIEALEQILGLTGKQNVADIKWVNYLLSLANNKQNSNRINHVYETPVRDLPVKVINKNIKYQDSERRSGRNSRRYAKLHFNMYCNSGNFCRRVNNDRRLPSRTEEYTGQKLIFKPSPVYYRDFS